MTKKKNIVLGLVKGYTREQLSPFVKSLRSTGYADEICFFYSDLNDSAIQFLRECDVNLVPFSLPRIPLLRRRPEFSRLFDRIYRSRLNRLVPVNRIYAGFINGMASVVNGNASLTKAKVAAKMLNVYCVRYPLYYLYLAGKEERYENVMLTDVRDVIFQRNPFDFPNKGELCVFLEDERERLVDCRFNTLLINHGYGETVLKEIGENLISCSGVTIGGYAAIMRYLELMVDQMIRMKGHPIGMDQGVHNFLLYKEKLTGARVFANDSGPVFTMGKTVDLPTKFNQEGMVLNKAGEIANVLHQYDRHIEHGKLTLNETSSRVILSKPTD